MQHIYPLFFFHHFHTLLAQASGKIWGSCILSMDTSEYVLGDWTTDPLGHGQPSLPPESHLPIKYMIQNIRYHQLWDTDASLKLVLLCSACPQRSYKQYILECSVHYKVERMPYSILPKSKPLGSKKVTKPDLFIRFYNFTNLVNLFACEQVCGGSFQFCGSCCSGGDGRDVEQAGQYVLCSSVDHHPGCARWAAVTLPAHISTVQGKKLKNSSTNTITIEN